MEPTATQVSNSPRWTITKQGTPPFHSHHPSPSPGFSPGLGVLSSLEPPLPPPRPQDPTEREGIQALVHAFIPPLIQFDKGMLEGLPGPGAGLSLILQGPPRLPWAGLGSYNYQGAQEGWDTPCRYHYGVRGHFSSAAKSLKRPCSNMCFSFPGCHMQGYKVVFSQWCPSLGCLAHS